MNSKGNRSYKLRTKQIAIHVRAYGQINKTVVTTRVEENLFTIDDLRSRKCALISDTNSLDELRAVLAYVFSKDPNRASGLYNYYFAARTDYSYWDCSDTTALPTQSAIKFFNQINK